MLRGELALRRPQCRAAGITGQPPLEERRRSALIGAAGSENLADLLRDDEHLAPFLAIPSKDNGLDVEGLVAHGDALYVGLRGPVLRGWAVVLEVLPVPDPTDPARLALGTWGDSTRYRKHFLDLGGLGVRDLCPDATTYWFSRARRCALRPGATAGRLA